MAVVVRRAAAGRSGGSRKGEFQRLDQIMAPALDRVASSDQAKAYGAWARASGEQVAAGTRLRNFSRGTLTVECSSSVWANELTYLSGQIKGRMDVLSPGHPVRKLRFTVSRSPRKQEDSPAASKEDPRRKPPAPPVLDGARAQAEGVRDERLRAAIEALLHPPTGGTSGPPGGDTSRG